MSNETVHYALQGTTAVIRMDDGKANALSDAMINQLDAAVRRAEGEASAIVLAGREGRFCAGFDLKVMSSGPDAARALLRRGSAFLMQLYSTSIPLVIACTGHALAGGALVVLTGDARIGAAGSFKVGLNEVAIGLPVPVLAMELARDRLLPSELTSATLHARMYAPDEALKAGYLDRVVPAAEVLTAAIEQASQLGALNQSAYKATKERLRGRTIRHIQDSLEQDLAALLG